MQYEMLSQMNLNELTWRIQPAAQIRWLRERQWIFEIGADWLPKVATAYFERRMVVGEADKQPGPPDGGGWQVNEAAIRRTPNE